MRGTILVVDDSKKVYDSLKPNFELLGYKTNHAFSMKTTIETMKTIDFDVALVDIMLGDENGIDILRRIKQIDEMLPVIMITGYASIDSAIESMKEGAYDYIKKPLEFDRLITIIENAAKLRYLSRENRQLKSRVTELKPKIYVENEKMAQMLAQARKLAAGDIPILIVGENGSGKEIIADYIHEHSQRSDFKMHKINCAAFPETLLDNELFGHEKGAYTGATDDFKGVFERANKGILFLDEIGDMPLSIQAKILRVLQNNEIRRIGGTVTKKIDIRFIAATNKNLES
ncbi:MAG: sigma-54 dependent transcriptional regulator, partial [Sphaerochaetaceae bacterium]